MESADPWGSQADKHDLRRIGQETSLIRKFLLIPIREVLSCLNAAKRVISVPVLVALGVAPDGQKRLLSLRLAVSEASTHWSSVLEGVLCQNSALLK